MALNGFPSRSNLPETMTWRCRGLGGNGAALTLQVGSAGITSARTGEGVYTMVWAENPGTFVGWQYSLAADTMGNIKGYTVIRDVWDSTTFTLTFTVYNASVTAADLIADEYIDFQVTFKQTSV